MTGISWYNSQLTHVYILHTEKKGHTVLPYVFIIAFQTSLLMTRLFVKQLPALPRSAKKYVGDIISKYVTIQPIIKIRKSSSVGIVAVILLIMSQNKELMLHWVYAKK